MATNEDLERLFYGGYLGLTDAQIAARSADQLRADFVANGPLNQTQLNAAYARLNAVNTFVNGQRFGTVGFNGNAAVGKAAAIATPSAPSAVYVQTEAQSMKTAVDAIRVALANVGITA